MEKNKIIPELILLRDCPRDTLYFIGKPNADDYQHGRVIRVGEIDIVPGKCAMISNITMP